MADCSCQAHRLDTQERLVNVDIINDTKQVRLAVVVADV